MSEQKPWNHISNAQPGDIVTHDYEVRAGLKIPVRWKVIEYAAPNRLLKGRYLCGPSPSSVGKIYAGIIFDPEDWVIEEDSFNRWVRETREEALCSNQSQE